MQHIFHHDGPSLILAKMDKIVAIDLFFAAAAARVWKCSTCDWHDTQRLNFGVVLSKKRR
jgi:hypothetical protein